MATVRIIHSANKHQEYIHITEDLETEAMDFVKYGDELISDEEIEWSHIPSKFPMESMFKKEN